MPCSRCSSTLSHTDAVWSSFFFFSSRRRHTRCLSDWSSDVCSSDLTLALGWRFEVAPRFPSASLEICATDADPRLLERARRACYARATLREVPPAWQIGRASCRERVWMAGGAGGANEKRGTRRVSAA